MKKKFLFLLICVLFLGTAFSFCVYATDTSTNSGEESEYIEEIDNIGVSSYSSKAIVVNSVSRDVGDLVVLWLDLDGDDYKDWFELIDSYEATIPTLDDRLVTAYDVQEEYEPTILEQLDDAMEDSYENAVKISRSSAKYNCHSYAWYSQNTAENTYWINEPLNFYDDSNEYVVVTTPRAGDIICYFNAAGKNLHSGIVVFYVGGTSNGVCGNSDLVYVQSKWGPSGLYEHRGDQCPYTTEAYGYDELTQNQKEESIAASVKYYRRVGHTHTYTPIYDATKQMHGKQCTGSDCGQIIWTFDHDYSASTAYYNSLSHKNICPCGAYELVPHDEYTEISHNAMYHTLELDCCDSRRVTFVHHFDEYDSDSHTGDCSYCSYTATSDLAHVVPYSNIGGGKHSGTCNWCDYTHTEPHTYMYTAISYSSHQIECEECDDYQVVADHIWDEKTDEEGNLITYCTGCGYVAGTEPLTADMIAKLSAELQTEIQSAPQNAQLNAQPDGDIYYVIRIDDENGILYFNGEYYLLHYSEIPDADLEPVPSAPAEDAVS